jgi:RHS repeat-associated protein
MAVTTQYLVEDDVNPTGLPQVFEESVNGIVQRTYTYGLQRISEDQPISGTWTPSFYGYDGFGTVRQLTNLAGSVTDTYSYDAFGNLLSSTGTTPNNYLYRGEQYDPDLNLYYLRARYYNPVTGRFLSRDSEDGDTLNPATLHRYLYVGGDPVNWWDPSGKFEIGEYEELSGKNGLQAHHIIEQRFSRTLGGFICGISVLLTKEEHQVFTNLWRAIPYGPVGALATPAQIFQMAENIYF